MGALARGDHLRGVGLGQMADGIGECAGGVDDDLGADFEAFAGFLTSCQVTPWMMPSAPLWSCGDLRVVEQRGALLGGGGDEIDEQPRVVELAVVVDDAAGEALGVDAGQALERFLLREELRGAEAVFAGEHLVELEADAVEGAFPPGVAGDDERRVRDEVRRVLAQEAALLQRLHHERDVALLEVAHAAVDELGRAAGGAFAEVVLLEQQRGVAARGGIDRDADAGGAAADDDDVPRFRPRTRLLQHVVSFHEFEIFLILVESRGRFPGIFLSAVRGESDKILQVLEFIQSARRRSFLAGPPIRRRSARSSGDNSAAPSVRPA